VSTEHRAARERQAWKALKDFLEKAEGAVEREVTRATPAVRRSLESSLESASKLFASTMKALDRHTEREQVEILKGYKVLLDAQSGFVESRLRSLEEKETSGKN
jgi:hypothetical protein